MRANDLNLAALDIRRAGELLLHPCNCSIDTHRWRISPCPARACTDGRVTIDGATEPCLHCWSTCTNGHVLEEGGEHWRPCPLCRPHTLVEHSLRARRDQRPGVRATNTDPRAPGGPSDTNDDRDDAPADDPTANGDQILLAAIRDCQRSAQRLTDLVQLGRPDRRVDAKDPATDDEFCAHHLATIGSCEPRWRGDQCRWCYRFQQVYSVAPPETLLRARHDGQRITQPMIAAALRTAAKAKGKGRKRRKAS